MANNKNDKNMKKGKCIADAEYLILYNMQKKFEILHTTIIFGYNAQYHIKFQSGSWWTLKKEPKQQ